MVIAPLSWCRGEWVDYTFAANLAPCLLDILRKKDIRASSRASHHKGTNRSLPTACTIHSYSTVFSSVFIFHTETLDRSVVLVRCGINWGTAILVDENTGTFLTCSHVVAEVNLFFFLSVPFERTNCAKHVLIARLRDL